MTSQNDNNESAPAELQGGQHDNNDAPNVNLGQETRKLEPTSCLFPYRSDVHDIAALLYSCSLTGSPALLKAAKSRLELSDIKRASAILRCPNDGGYEMLVLINAAQVPSEPAINKAWKTFLRAHPDLVDYPFKDEEVHQAIKSLNAYFLDRSIMASHLRLTVIELLMRIQANKEEAPNMTTMTADAVNHILVTFGKQSNSAYYPVTKGDFQGCEAISASMAKLFRAMQEDLGNEAAYIRDYLGDSGGLNCFLTDLPKLMAVTNDLDAAEMMFSNVHRFNFSLAFARYGELSKAYGEKAKIFEEMRLDYKSESARLSENKVDGASGA